MASFNTDKVELLNSIQAFSLQVFVLVCEIQHENLKFSILKSDIHGSVLIMW